ncbi:MAG TPA: hypothetical protein VNS32_12745 [Flavisolibacter sp.]|nr:hypothetical protein [Flavisolibacter sp.]
MKKLIALFVAIASFVLVHAQNTREESRRQIFGTPASKPRTVQQSRTVVFGNNRNSTAYHRTYPAYRKTYTHRTYKPVKRRYHEDEDDDRRGWKHHKEWKGHHDNGKHLGWYKGKGNPHRH